MSAEREYILLDEFRRRSSALGIARYHWPNPAAIPPRPWLLPPILIRGEVTILAGSGGRAKTAWAIAASIGAVAGRAIVGLQPHSSCRRVCYIHPEEPNSEFDRRIAAARLHYHLDPTALASDRFLDHSCEGLVIATQTESGRLECHQPLIDALVAYIKDHAIDVLVVDPYVVCYAGAENDNKTQSDVIRAWKAIAEAASCAVLLIHHFRKGAAEPGDADAARGGGALVTTSRGTFTLALMSKAEAQTFGIGEDQRKSLVRLDDAKLNMTAAGRERWYRIVSVSIGNPTDDYPAGDSVHTVECWTPPNAFSGVSSEKLNEALDAIESGTPTGDRYTRLKRSNSTNWAGHVICRVTGKSEEEAKVILREWLTNGVLFEDEYENTQRHPARGLFLNPLNRPGVKHD